MMSGRAAPHRCREAIMQKGGKEQERHVGFGCGDALEFEEFVNE